MDDVRAGRALRLLRQRRGWTQAELGRAAGLSQSVVSLAERGHLDTLAMRTIRSLFGVLDARTELHVSWRGGALDRLLDEAHASLVLRRAATLREEGWTVALEATYSVYGERGSIDVFAAKSAEQAVTVEEVKTDLTSLEQLGRKTDEKVRLVRTRICRERFGFAPQAVARILVLPETSTARRQVERLAPALDAMFPARTREIQRWMRRPVGDISGILFVADMNRGGVRCDRRGRTRVRTPRKAAV